MMDKKRLKRVQERRKHFEKVVESLKYLKNNSDIIKVIAKDTTYDTEGYLFSVEDLIKNYKIEIERMNNHIENMMRERE
jgi:MoaA/NifB/PqqE/SkfB family radical SAM enzyme